MHGAGAWGRRQRLDSGTSLLTFIENIRHRELILAEAVNNELTSR